MLLHFPEITCQSSSLVLLHPAHLTYFLGIYAFYIETLGYQDAASIFSLDEA